MDDLSLLNVTTNVATIESTTITSGMLLQGKRSATANDQTQSNRSIISTGYKDAPQYRSIAEGTLRERTSNTGIVGFRGLKSNLRREIPLMSKLPLV